MERDAPRAADFSFLFKFASFKGNKLVRWLHLECHGRLRVLLNFIVFSFFSVSEPASSRNRKSKSIDWLIYSNWPECDGR